MRCKDCSVGVKGKCPTCNVNLMICGEFEETAEFRFWEKEDIGCDGIG